MATAVFDAGAPPAAAPAAAEEAVRERSPRIMASAWMTVLPPSMIFCVPTRTAFLATLLPVSCDALGQPLLFHRAMEIDQACHTVSMYSPLGAFRDMVAGCVEGLVCQL